MTSKEALERVKTAPQYHNERSVYANYTSSSLAFDEDIEIIEKDLELLEILKLLFKEGYNDFGKFITSYIRLDIKDKNFDRVKEIIKNE